jgi:hypothetical protein
MGSQTSKATSTVTESLASQIQSTCNADGSGYQRVNCNFYISPSCNNSVFNCVNNSTASLNCNESTLSTIAQQALATASASTQAGALSAWNAQDSVTKAATISDMTAAIASQCFANAKTNQEASAEVKCYGHNDVIDVFNNSNVQTQCVLNTVQNLVQTAEAQASSKATKTGLIAGVIVLVVIIVVVVVVVVYVKKKKGGGGGGGGGGGASKGGGEIELVGVPAAPAAPAAAPAAGAGAGAPAAGAGAGAGAAGTAPAAPAAAPAGAAPPVAAGIGGRYGWRQERYW